jgi:hypothetical protein
MKCTVSYFRRGIFASDRIFLNWPVNLAGREQHCPPPLLPGQDSMLNTVIMSTQLPCTRDPWHCLAVPLEKGGWQTEIVGQEAGSSDGNRMADKI